MSKINTYKNIYFFSTLYMCLMTLSAVLSNKLISTPYGVLSAASLISPFWYIVGDIITELYGINIVMKLFWSVIICQFIFAIGCWLIIKLPSPMYWSGETSYQFVCGHLFKIAVFQFIGITLAWNINARLLNKWKVLLKGKYFWLRSIGASGIGLVVFSIVSIFPSIYGTVSLNVVLSIVGWSCFLKIFLMILLSGPSNFLVFILKADEGINEYNQNILYNPFKLA